MHELILLELSLICFRFSGVVCHKTEGTASMSIRWADFWNVNQFPSGQNTTEISLVIIYELKMGTIQYNLLLIIYIIIIYYVIIYYTIYRRISILLIKKHTMKGINITNRKHRSSIITKLWLHKKIHTKIKQNKWEPNNVVWTFCNCIFTSWIYCFQLFI